jgi:hypothetical protein
MRTASILELDSDQQNRIEGLERRYRAMHGNPRGASPMIIVDVETTAIPTWAERLADPRAMMEAELAQMRPHVELQDDCIPTLRVELGTGQVAAAFGCEIMYPENSYPAVRSHVLKDAEDVYSLPLPSLHAGMYGKLEEFTRFFRENMPDGMRIQPPDLQSPFNCAHLIRGNDVLLDFIDNPRALDALLDKITDYMILLVPHLRSMINCEDGWFLDYGALWKGGARISNCSMQMISPDFYRRHVLDRDRRLFRQTGGGRIHYCGTNTDVVHDFFSVPGCSGFDFLGGMKYDEVWRVTADAPAGVVILKNADAGSPEMERLLAGDWPARRAIIIKTLCRSMDEGRDVLARLRESIRGRKGPS